MGENLAYLTLSDGKIYFALRTGRGAAPLLFWKEADSADKALKIALDHARMQRVSFDRAVVAIDARDCLIRNYQLPRRGYQQIASMVGYELESDVPFDVQSLEWDHIIGLTKGGMAHVLVAAVKTELISELLTVFKAHGVEPEKIDVDVAAFARACAAIADERVPSIGLDIGRNRTLCCYLLGKNVKKIACCPYGENHLFEEVAKETGKSVEEIVRTMILGGRFGQTDRSEENDDLLSLHLNMFLQKMLRDVSRIFRDEEWPPLFIVSGEVVRLKGFRQRFETISDAQLVVWEEKSLGPGSETEEGLRESGFALGFGSEYKHRAAFNFRKGKFAFEQKKISWSPKYVAPVAALSALLLSWFIYMYAGIVDAEHTIDFFKTSSLQAYRNALPDVNQDFVIEQYESILDSRMGVLSGQDSTKDKATRTPVIEVLRNINAALAPTLDVEFISVNLNEKQISIQGITKSMDEVDQLRTALGGMFRAVVLKNAKADSKAKGIRFQIEVER